jgi:L-threonylcarbamoyladenylate synthase
LIRLASPESIAKAAGLIRQGELVAFPTETVYGLGGDATNDRAVARIFAAKGRPSFNPLIVHLADREAALALGRADSRTHEIAARFWPGPVSLVMTRAAACSVSLLASAGLDTIALRVPANPVAQALLRQAGRPIAAPSANRSGELSPTRADHVASSLGDGVALILDGGPCAIGLESTVLDLSGAQPILLRPGGVSRESLEAVLGPIAVPEWSDHPERPRSPGQLRSHYAPRLPVRMAAENVGADEALLGFGRDLPAGAAAALNLSRKGDLLEAAANLFAMLRELDRPGLRAIAVVPIPERGLGVAINDRLRRAAAPRGN